MILYFKIVLYDEIHVEDEGFGLVSIIKRIGSIRCDSSAFKKFSLNFFFLSFYPICL